MSLKRAFQSTFDFAASAYSVSKRILVLSVVGYSGYLVYQQQKLQKRFLTVDPETTLYWRPSKERITEAPAQKSLQKLLLKAGHYESITLLEYLF